MVTDHIMNYIDILNKNQLINLKIKSKINEKFDI